MYGKKIIIIAIFLIISVCIYCNIVQKEKSGGPFFFKSFKTYHAFPMVPSEEISIDDATSLKTYYMAYYDKDGKIIFFAKYLNGKLHFFAQYEYEGKKIKHAIIENADGQVMKTMHDVDGKILLSITKEINGQVKIIPYSKGERINLNE